MKELCAFEKSKIANPYFLLNFLELRCKSLKDFYFCITLNPKIILIYAFETHN